jgi:hypothetical protein
MNDMNDQTISFNNPLLMTLKNNQLNANSSVQNEQKLKRLLSKKLKESLLKNNTCPVVSATSLWQGLAKQLEVILGATLFQQIFMKVHPLVLSDQILLLKTKDKQQAQWLNLHYKEVIDALLSCHDKNLSCVFISSNKQSRFDSN